MTWSASNKKLAYQGVEYSEESEFEKIIDLGRDLELPHQVAVGRRKHALR